MYLCSVAMYRRGTIQRVVLSPMTITIRGGEILTRRIRVDPPRTIVIPAKMQRNQPSKPFKPSIHQLSQSASPSKPFCQSAHQVKPSNHPLRQSLRPSIYPSSRPSKPFSPSDRVIKASIPALLQPVSRSIHRTIRPSSHPTILRRSDPSFSNVRRPEFLALLRLLVRGTRLTSQEKKCHNPL
jgi:hypothetical protein